MNGDDHARRSRDRAQCQEAQRWGSVQNDDIIAVFDFGQRKLEPFEKDRPRSFLAGKHAGRFVLELHDFKIAWNKIDTSEVGLSNDVAHWPALSIIVTQCSKYGLVGPDIDFGLGTKKCRKRSLRIKIESKHPVSMES